MLTHERNEIVRTGVNYPKSPQLIIWESLWTKKGQASREGILITHGLSPKLNQPPAWWSKISKLVSSWMSFE